jgi:zona occludens toxin
MAITAYIGRPGSGKSYGAVQNVILPALKAGRRVVTNIPMNLEALQENGYPTDQLEQFESKAPTEDYEFFTFEKNPTFKGSTIVVDEPWRYWPTGTKAAQIPEPIRAFFAEHRHHTSDAGHSTQIVLVTQDLSQIASFIRKLIDKTFICSKLDALGLGARFRLEIYSGSVGIDDTYFAKERKLNVLTGKYKPAVYQFYKSQTQNDADVPADESMVDRRTTIWRHPAFMVGAPLSLLMFGLSINAMASFLWPESDDPVPPVPTQAVSPSASPSSRPAKVVQAPKVLSGRTLEPETEYSARWRLVGVMYSGPQDGTAVIQHTDGSQRNIPIRGSCVRYTNVQWEWKCMVEDELVTFFSGRGRSSSQPQGLLSLNGR